MHALPVALYHSPSPSLPPVCPQLNPWRLKKQKGIAIQLFYEADAVTIGIQQLTDIAVVIGNRSPDPDRTAQEAAADQVMHGMALAVAAVLFPNRRDQDPQAKYGRQGPLQAVARSPQGHSRPANGERRPRAWPGQGADARRLRKNNLVARWLQAGP